MDVAAFVESQLPAPPARVLEVGCGSGSLARALAAVDYRLVAIDPRAPVGDIFESVTLEEFSGTGPFDAVVANRALHHIPSLRGALDKIARLLAAGGLLIVHEHAWERMDEPTARWYLERRGAFDPTAPRSVEQCLTDWAAAHAGLHGYADMRTELDRHFEERFFAWTPYLYGELGGRDVEPEERALIDSRTIQATGFYYVGQA
jgi:SAM-dependent methyltransferase